MRQSSVSVWCAPESGRFSNRTSPSLQSRQLAIISAVAHLLCFDDGGFDRLPISEQCQKWRARIYALGALYFGLTKHLAESAVASPDPMDYLPRVSTAPMWLAAA